MTMYLNIARLSFKMPAGAAERLATVLTREVMSLEESLAPLCSRQLSADPETVRLHQKPALPFVFDLPLQAGSSSVTNLLLAGPSISFMPLFCRVVARHSGLSQFSEITAMNYQGEQTGINLKSGDNLPVLSTADLLDIRSPEFAACSGVRVAIHTPLRLVSAGRELTRFCPVVFTRSLLRRLSSLAAYYGSGADPEQFRRLADMAGRLSASKSYSIDFLSAKRGVTGCFDLYGPLAELGPYLALGSLFHLGKGAAFGMGRFDVSPLYC